MSFTNKRPNYAPFKCIIQWQFEKQCDFQKEVRKYISSRSPLRKHRCNSVSVWHEFCAWHCCAASGKRYGLAANQRAGKGAVYRRQVGGKLRQGEQGESASPLLLHKRRHARALIQFYCVCKRPRGSLTLPVSFNSNLLVINNNKKKVHSEAVKSLLCWGEQKTGSVFLHIFSFLMVKGMAPDRLNINHLDSFV